MKTKILLLVPDLKASGGIKNYFKVLENKFPNEVEYFVRGSRTWPYRKSKIAELFRAFKDLLKYINKIRSKNYQLVQTSTSLGSYAIIRDGFFLLFARLYKLKTIVFFRGLDERVVEKLEKYFLWLFKWSFFKTDSFIVLSSSFEHKLSSWGYKKKIYNETTLVDNGLLEEFSKNEIENKYNAKLKRISILFLARVEIEKGIYEAIETYEIIKKEFPDVLMNIAGDGRELDKCKKYVQEKNIQNINFIGYVSGKKKTEVLKSAHIYIFLSYTEGMPNSVLEAMAFGLPVVTRNVGGLKDFFQNGKNGFITDSKEPQVFAELIKRLIMNETLMKEISFNNFNYAQDIFLSSKVVKRLEKIYAEVLEEGDSE